MSDYILSASNLLRIIHKSLMSSDSWGHECIKHWNPFQMEMQMLPLWVESWMCCLQLQCVDAVLLHSKFGVTFSIRLVCARSVVLISNENKIQSDGISSATPSMWAGSERCRSIRSLDTRKRYTYIYIKSVLFFRSLNGSVPILQMRNRPTDKNANRTLDEKIEKTKNDKGKQRRMASNVANTRPANIVG